MPIPQRLTSEEKSIALLSSILLRLPPSSPVFCMARVEQARAKRQIAVSKKQMNHIWKDQDEPNKQTQEKSKTQDLPDQEEEEEEEVESLINIKIDYRLESLKYINELREAEASLKSWSSLSAEYHYGALLNLEIMENFGLLAKEISFESMSKFQNFEVLEWLYGDLIKKFSPPTSSQVPNHLNSSIPMSGQSWSGRGEGRLHLLQRLSKRAKENGVGVGGEVVGGMNEFKSLDMGRDVPGWKEVKEMMPNNSAYLVSLSKLIGKRKSWGWGWGWS